MSVARKIQKVMKVVMILAMIVGADKRIYAESEAHMEVSAVWETTADTLTVNINLTENPGIAGLIFDVQYDEAVLQLDSITTDTLDEPLVNDETGGSIGYVYAEAVQTKDTGMVLCAEFKVLEKEKLKSSEIRIKDTDVCNENMETVLIAVKDGTVESLLAVESGTEDVVEDKTVQALSVIAVGVLIAGCAVWATHKEKKKGK